MPTLVAEAGRSLLPTRMEVTLESGSCTDRQNFEEHDRKSLECLQETIKRNTDVNGSTSKDSRGLGMWQGKPKSPQRIHRCEQTTSRNMTIKGAASGDSEGNKEPLVGSGRKEDPC